MKFGAPISLLTCLLFFVSCAKDKNMDDYRRDQLQQSLSRISSISGAYSGSVISKIDGSNLGLITLKFQARTDVESRAGQISSEQNAIVSGSLNFRSLTAAEVVFDNGFYDDVTGDFQVSIPISEGNGTTSKLTLIGKVSGERWIGSIEVKGQPEYGGQLDLQKNAPPSNTSAIEIGGIRLQQINRMSLAYSGAYKTGEQMTPFQMSFINRDILPEQKFYRLFSPVRNINVNCDFTDFELNFSDAIIDDKAGTLSGHDPVDQRGNPARANLSCLKFDNGLDDFGWDCELQTKVTILRLHLKAK